MTTDDTAATRLRAWLAGKTAIICAADVLAILNERDALRAACVDLIVAEQEAVSDNPIAELCVYFNRPGHTPQQKPHPRVYNGSPDNWLLCVGCRRTIDSLR